MSIPRPRRYPMRTITRRSALTPAHMAGKRIADALKAYYAAGGTLTTPTRAAQDAHTAPQTAHGPTDSHQPAERPTA